MTAQAPQAPVARSYTRARRHPWVLGKLGEIRLWLGPYSRPQLVVGGVGLLVLGKTIPLWWPALGPLPVVGLGFAVWAVRCARIGGRVPEAALWGWVLLLVQPKGGRIAGRPAKEPATTRLEGGFFLSESPNAESGSAPGMTGRHDRTPARPARPALSRPSRPLRPGRRPVRPPRPNWAPAPNSVSHRRHTDAPLPTPSVRPRSSLDLLLEQAGARTPAERP